MHGYGEQISRCVRQPDRPCGRGQLVQAGSVVKNPEAIDVGRCSDLGVDATDFLQTWLEVPRSAERQRISAPKRVSGQTGFCATRSKVVHFPAFHQDRDCADGIQIRSVRRRTRGPRTIQVSQPISYESTHSRRPRSRFPQTNCRQCRPAQKPTKTSKILTVPDLFLNGRARLQLHLARKILSGDSCLGTPCSR